MKKTSTKKTETVAKSKPKRMTWKKAATLSASVTVWAAASHYYAWAWSVTETVVTEKYNQVRFEIAEAAAASIGYAKPEPIVVMNELETLDYATNEALKQKVNPSFVRALLRRESGKNPNAVSVKGAQGLMQVMPENAYRCGLTKAELKDPKKNIACGVKLLREDLEAVNWQPWPAVERYNGGPKCVGMKCQESIAHARNVLQTMMQDYFERPAPEVTEITYKNKEELQQKLAQLQDRGLL